MLKLNDNEVKELTAMACVLGLYQQLKEAVENPKSRVIDYETTMESVIRTIKLWKIDICEEKLEEEDEES